MENFTPISGFVGGALIGTAAGVLWLLQGRIAGISGIVGSLFQDRSKASEWRWIFLTGLLAGGLVLYHGGFISFPSPFPAPWWRLIVGGFVMGFGARLGSGCTSGHGVCGISRLSKRSILATLIFFVMAIATVAIFGVPQ